MESSEIRNGGRNWLQMLARAGVTQIPSGSPESEMAQWVTDVQDSENQLLTDAGTMDDASATVEPSHHSTSVANSDNTDSPAGTSRPQRASIVANSGPSGKNPALKRTSEAVDDGEPLDRYENFPDEVRHTKLQILAEEVRQCTNCPELVAYRTQTVFGVGNIRPRLVMMGEAPGADEDRLGEPMVGVAGQLLDKIIAAMKLKREDVYILNTVKCRPPQNRNPNEDECNNCRTYWRQQLEILKPEVIVCLGAVASKTLLQTTLPVGRLRGKFHDYRGVPVSVTYHPAYLLRTASAKRQTWDDMKMVMAKLGIET